MLIVSVVVARAQRRDDSWFALASSELGVPETVLRDYAAHGDNLSLAILIHITRQHFNLSREWYGLSIMSFLLRVASGFNIQDTSPELQHEFCALWNRMVLEAQNNDDRMIALNILIQIRNVYTALHQGTDNSNLGPSLSQLSSYPLCNVHGHHLDSTPHVHDISASITSVNNVLQDHDDAALVPASLPTGSSPDAPSSSVPAPLPVGESLTDVPPLDHNISVPVSTLSANQTTIESRRIPATPQDPVTVHVMQGGIDTFARTVSISTPEPSASNPPPTSTPPPDAVAV